MKISPEKIPEILNFFPLSFKGAQHIKLPNFLAFTLNCCSLRLKINFLFKIDLKLSKF